MDVQITDPEAAERPAARLSAEDVPAMAALMDQYLNLARVQRGTIVEGVIVSIGATEILVDIGCKTEGIITAREMERWEPDVLSAMRVGDEVLACVVRPEDQDGRVVLSLGRAQTERDWRDAEKKQSSGEVVEVPAVDANRGGLIVSLGGLRGFVPASQLGQDHRSSGRKSAKTDGDMPWKDRIGQTISVKVLEVDRLRNRLIVSERLAERERRKDQRDRLLLELAEGDHRRGVVRSVCDFGAFVDLGGVDGLVHLSELCWKRVRHPSEVVDVGDEVEVYVLNVDRDHQRIGLSMRRLQAEPWSLAAQQYQVGQVVDAEVTRVTDFGAFALVGGEIEGLIHVSELAAQRVEHPREVLRERDVVQVRILRIDPERQRLALSLRQAAEDYVEVDWELEQAAASAAQVVEPATEGDSMTVADVAALSPAGMEDG
jgi:small subunit ribosomal protein S1